MHPRNEIPRHRRGIVLLALLSGLLLVLASPAAAQFHVTQPDMKKGEATIGDHAAIYDGPGRMSGSTRGTSLKAPTTSPTD